MRCASAIRISSRSLTLMILTNSRASFVRADRVTELLAFFRSLCWVLLSRVSFPLTVFCDCFLPTIFVLWVNFGRLYCRVLHLLEPQYFVLVLSRVFPAESDGDDEAAHEESVGQSAAEG